MKSNEDSIFNFEYVFILICLKCLSYFDSEKALINITFTLNQYVVLPQNFTTKSNCIQNKENQ